MELKKITTFILLLSTFYFLVSSFVFAQSNVPACPTLSRGSQGECVRFLQKSLNTLINAGLTVDAIFGPATESAVRTFQGQNSITVDGVVGAQTWSAIDRRLTGQSGLPGYNLPPLPTGTGYTQGEIQSILIRFANFLIAAGIILGVITIVVSGIMYFKAGSDIKAESAKAWFKNGIIGAFIILAVGVIILTIYNIVVDRTFFGGPTIPGSAPVSGSLGSSCQTDINCDIGLKCKGTGIFGTGPKTCQQP